MTAIEKTEENLTEGDFVQHATFGLGKVVCRISDEIDVYFPDSNDAHPGKRVRRFRLPTEFLIATVERSVDLDNLPLWRDGKFFGSPANLTLTGARDVFLRHFPNGLDDTRFLSQETSYKRSAHTRWIAAREQLETDTAAENVVQLVDVIETIYGDRQRTEDAQARLNFMYQRVDEPAFFDALKKGGPATVEYARAVVSFIDQPAETTFSRLATSLGKLTSRAGKSLDGWTTLTWLPFVADPRRHFLIKPTIVQRFASSIPFDIRYRSDLNFETYSSCVAMAQRLGRWLASCDLNRSRRQLDLIDVQSFMWVVEHYLPGD